MRQHLRVVLSLAALGSGLTTAHADIVIGGLISITGPTAAQGVGYRNAFTLFPKEIAGEKITYIVRDDAADPNNAVAAAKKMITEDKVDVIIGPSITTTTMPVAYVANESHVPMIGIAPLVFDAKQFPWAFAVPQPATLMDGGLVEHMKAHGVKTVGFIGYSDTWGDQNFNALKLHAAKAGIEIVAEERYARTDTSVQAQVLRVMSRHPDAVMLGGSATPGALPNIALRERGFKGLIYNNEAVVSPDYIRVGGAAVEGCIAVTGPVVVFDQLPDASPVRPVAVPFMEQYVASYGQQSRNAFAGYSYDAMLLVEKAIPEALKKAKPGTPEFRQALRDALEGLKEVVGSHAVYTMSPADHNGVDARARVLVEVKEGKWSLVK